MRHHVCSPAAVVSYSISQAGGNVANMILPITLRDRGFLVLPGASSCTHVNVTRVYKYMERKTQI